MYKQPGVSERPVTYREVDLNGGLINDLVFIHGGTCSDVSGAFPVVAAGATVCFAGADISSMTVSGTVRAVSSSVLSGTFIGHTFGGLSVCSGCTVIDTSVYEGGNLDVREGAVASGTVLGYFGHMTVSSGGLASDTKVKGGMMTVCRGAEVSVLDIGGGGTVNIETNAHVSEVVVDSGGTVYIGASLACDRMYDPDEETCSYLYISAGGYAEVMDNRTIVENVYVSSGGSMRVKSGCVANSVCLKKGAELTVESGGTVLCLYGQGSAGLIANQGAKIFYRNGKEN